MRFVNLGVDAVVLCDLGMNAKQHRFCFLGQISPTQGAFYAFNSYFGCVNYGFAHGISFLIILIEVFGSNFLGLHFVLVLVTRNRPVLKSEDEDRCAEYRYDT
jgi:hypothetical protein